MSDVVSEVMRSVRLNACVYFERDFFAPWAMRIADTGFAQFHVVTSGRCVLTAGPETRDVATGDVLLFPRGLAHVLADRPGREPSEGPQVMASFATDRPMFSTGDAPTRIICGHFDYRWDVQHPLFDELPGTIHLTSRETGGSAAIRAILGLIMEEIERGAPGSDYSVERLAEALLVRVLRAHYQSAERPHGFFAGLGDSRLSRAIARIHSDYASALTLGELARSAAMSRSAFSARFSELVGMPPVEYLGRWRMTVAHSLLSTSDRRLSDIAAMVGYGSDIAFSRAFKRRFGMSPGAVRAGNGTSEVR